MIQSKLDLQGFPDGSFFIQTVFFQDESRDGCSGGVLSIRVQGRVLHVHLSYSFMIQVGFCSRRRSSLNKRYF